MRISGIRAAIHIASVFALYLAGAMLLPAIVDLYYGHEDWRAFTLSSALVGCAAFAIMLATRGRSPQFSTRFGFFLVNLLWLVTSVAGAVPFVASGLGIGVTDAFFESVSGVTTTGATVLNGLDNAPPGILLWRSLLNFLGGLGVIALGIFLLPFLNIGGISYLRIESSDIEDRPFARVRTFAISLLSLYVGLVIACGFSYYFAGMEAFPALNHAMSTVATGGFSIHDTSFFRYSDQPSILWSGSLFMFVGALPFSIMMLVAVRGRYDALRDPQMRVFAIYTAVFAVAVAIYVSKQRDITFVDALTHSTFNFVSVITTSGFSSDDYGLWGPFAVAAIFVATFLGGCSGSTTGGIKAYRFFVLAELLINGLRRLIHPHVVQPVRYGGRTVDDDMQRAVILFIASFFIFWAMFTLLLAATGLDLVTATTGALSSLTNVGPGLGPIIGPAGNFSSLPDAAKWICALAMLLGRLEILAVLVVFTPAFWSR